VPGISLRLAGPPLESIIRGLVEEKKTLPLCYLFSLVIFLFGQQQESAPTFIDDIGPYPND
jgi:hypothetical protein